MNYVIAIRLSIIRNYNGEWEGSSFVVVVETTTQFEEGSAPARVSITIQQFTKLVQAPSIFLQYGILRTS